MEGEHETQTMDVHKCHIQTLIFATTRSLPVCLQCATFLVCVCKYVNQSWCFMTTQESSNRPFIGLCKCHIQFLIFFRFVSSVLHSKLFKGNYHIYSQVLSQLLHWNGCSPVWVLSWNQLWYCKEKALSHWMHWNGFCPVWVIWCLTRSPLWLKALPH